MKLWGGGRLFSTDNAQSQVRSSNNNTIQFKSESKFPYFTSAKLTILASCYFVTHWYVDPELVAGINNSTGNAVLT